MFKKLIVVDAKGHLLGRLASYIAKTLLSGTAFYIQAKESQSSEQRESTSPALSSETRLNSPSSSGRDSSPILEELSSTTGHLRKYSGGLSEVCFLIKPQEGLKLSED
jgi:hypothetical protein